MNKDIEDMLHDSMFWYIVVFMLAVAIALIVAFAGAVYVASFIIGVFVGTLVLMIRAARKMYKANKYWHYRKDE